MPKLTKLKIMLRGPHQFHSNGQARQLSVDTILAATGRRANIDHLGQTELRRNQPPWRCGK